ncbi:hypothetical protein V7x_24780 [Crateriforma conspicua]|uniref:Uncharacterized protein n=1 Tax=Crateriforma conspicua TaxID=2527996 RepID=A0A5C6FWZ9_9PLAN|nr:hypothetical protein [Crateriforma conspicua]TWU66906.1 hypothetical protein V7x_24780 [Crateriforma conspicua]
MSKFILPIEPPTPNPSAGQPGTLGDQLSAVTVAIYLGRRRGTDARHEWDDARRLVIPHASNGQEGQA